MSGFLFLMVIDWVMRKTVDGQRTAIRWDFTMLLEDIDYADDLLLPTSRADHIQEKTARLEENAGRVGFKLNPQKFKTQSVREVRRRWYRIEHFPRKEANSDCVVALGLKPEGKRGRGRPKTTWRRTVEKERDRQGWSTR